MCGIPAGHQVMMVASVGRSGCYVVGIAVAGLADLPFANDAQPGVVVFGNTQRRMTAANSSG